jgi:pimeloyl-ACP methyl ester carboxylesterase
MFEHSVSLEKSTNVRVSIFQKFNSILSRLAPGLAAGLAQKMFVTPIPSRRPDRELRWAESAARTKLPSPLGPIPLWVWGDGAETVVLVHGWSGRGLQLGAFVDPLLESGFRVVAFDAPGHGEAPGRTSSMPAFAATLGAVGRRFGPVAAVIAHSLGATAAIYALANRELEAQRLVAISPAARLHAVRERFGAMAGFPPEVIDMMGRAFEDRFGFDWNASEPLRLARQLPIPALVVHDANDRFIPHGEAVELADAWADSRLSTTNGLGHHRILRDSDVIAQCVYFVLVRGALPLAERRAS